MAQNDSVPGGGEMPLTSWLVGEYVQDDVKITMPPDLPSGQYRLAVGMYDPATGQSLTTPDDREQILLSRNIDVQ